jgi:hypothetical protein
MVSKIHRRTTSNDGTVETILSSLPPSRSSSNSSNTTMDTHNNEKDIEAFHPLIPSRGRSQQQQSNGIVMIDTKNDSDHNNNNNNDSTTKGDNSVKLSGSAWKAIMACLNYSFCSVSMILVNKSLASR